MGQSFASIPLCLVVMFILFIWILYMYHHLMVESEENDELLASFTNHRPPPPLPPPLPADPTPTCGARSLLIICVRRDLSNRRGQTPLVSRCLQSCTKRNTRRISHRLLLSTSALAAWQMNPADCFHGNAKVAAEDGQPRPPAAPAPPI